MLAFLLSTFATLSAAERPAATATLSPDASRLIVDVHGLPPPAAVFFAATVDQTVRVTPAEITGELKVDVRLVQGRPEVLSLGLAGDGEVVDVSGIHLREWSVRQDAGVATGQRFLDLRVETPPVGGGKPADGPREFGFVVRTRQVKPPVPGNAALLVASPGEAVGFVANIAVQADPAIELRVVEASGLMPVTSADPSPGISRFVCSGEGRLEVSLAPRGAARPDLELIGAALSGRWHEPSGAIEFRLRGQLRAQKAGGRLRLLTGGAAFTGRIAADGWHAEIVALEKGAFAYEIVADREGTFSLDLAFAAPVAEVGDWRLVEFGMPAGAVVPLQLEGFGHGVTFNPDAPVVPATTPAGWQGFLPASGAASFAWKRTRDAAEGTLFFTTTEQTEVRLGAGLLRQTSQVGFRILQGRLAAIRCRIDGPGEILGAEGPNIVGWKVLPFEGARLLEVALSRPIDAEGKLTVHAQAELGGWPVRVEPTRLTPLSGVRHSGFIRIANRGAVRLELTDVAGMMQLAPAQFPGPAIEPGARQVFVYRFPSANYGYRVHAAQIQSEVGLSTIVTYELGESARVINASLELDVREAPLRDWSLRIPADYTVVSVTGSDVADYVAESEAGEGYRTLRVLFAKAIQGRQLLQLRLEKNETAAAGDWSLAPLRFPDAKTVRGHVGVVAAPGFRIAPVRVDRLVDVPLSFFPKQAAGLQQAWRLREPDWTAELRIEALGQSVQADVFHLYSLKEGMVTTSVLLNYFVVGAPAGEWRVEVPADVGNIDVIGQNVRRDWRREGDQVIVALHQPVLGAATLLITFEQPMSARGGVIAPGQVRPLGVQAERGYIQVVSPFQVKHETRRLDGGLLKLEPTELPPELRVFTSSPSLAVYQYTGRPFAFEMGIEWYAPGETVEQVVDFARLSSQVSRDGQVLTEATFYVKTRGRKALRLVLPAGTKLWDARVDNEVVNARADGEHTLVPLPARLNPNEPVGVVLRLGQTAAGAGTRIALVAPRAVAAPTVINEWTVRSDTGRLLVPRGGTAELVQPALTETGFEWLSSRGVTGTVVTLTLVLLGAALLHSPVGWRMPTGLLALALSAAAALLMTGRALVERRPNAAELSFAATVVPAGEAVSLELANVPEWRAMLVGWGIAAGAAGVAVLFAAGRTRKLEGRANPPGEPMTARRGRLALPVAGTLLLTCGLLAQRGGAVLFFTAVSAGVFLRMIVPGVLLWRRERRERTIAPGAGPAGAVPLVAIAGFLALAALGGGKLEAATPGSAAAPAGRTGAGVMPARPGKGVDAIVQTWSIRGERLFGEAEVTVRGAAGDSFLLLRAPAVLTSFNGEGLRVGKAGRDGTTAYYLAPERAGVLTARMSFELPLPDRTKAIAVPTGPAATQRVTIELDQDGWEFASTAAVQISPTPGLGGNRSGATLVLAPQAAPTIRLQPRRRDLSAETTQYFVETANLYVPGPGVINGFARVSIRPAQGRVSALEIDVPAGLTVGEVGKGPIGAWRFDPQKRRLHVAVEPAQSGLFAFHVETQIAAGELPFAVALEPLRVLGAAGDVGLIALAFGGDAQPEGIRATDLSVVNVQDFDAALLPRNAEKQPLATLQHAWRHGPAGGRVELRIAAVAPEVRVTTRQVVSLDDDRLVIGVDLRASITRVGIFKLSFALPDGLEIEALSGPALNHWTEAQENGARIITLHLNGRTLGEETFNLSVAGPAPRAQEGWPLPRVVVREASRQTGELLIVPGKGIRLRPLQREQVTQLDPRSIGGVQPGTLAFRVLQKDWALQLGIEMLEPWVTVQALQEATLREGQTLTRIAVRYRVENAAVKQAQVRLPGLGEAVARTVRATGTAVSDLVRLTPDGDVWEIRFQRGIAGDTDVQIEFQAPAERDRRQESIATPEFVGARQVGQFVAVRGGGRLELEAGALPRGWLRIDWSAVPVMLQRRGDRSMPALCFRVAEAESALPVVVRRHDVAEALKLRVTQAGLMTLFAPGGAALTAVELKIDVIEKSTLRVRLPAGARLFNTLVNDENMPVVRDGEAWLFHVSPGAADNRTGTVRLVYSVGAVPNGDVSLVGPSLSVPLENVAWRVVIPAGYELKDYSGGLRLRDERFGGAFGLENYVSVVSSKRSAESKESMALLQQASSWMQAGQQDKAAGALLNASNRNNFDLAANEDARVQLRNLKTQQAVLGLNTRRQRMYLENNGGAVRNEQLEQAANLNPFMKGAVNFNPQQADQLLLGNTAEENSTLRGIAGKIVDQQLAAEPPPGAIDVTLPERGRVLTFTRSVQVNGGTPLELRLDVEKFSRVDARLVALVLAGIAAIAAAEWSRRNATGAP